MKIVWSTDRHDETGVGEGGFIEYGIEPREKMLMILSDPNHLNDENRL